MKQYLIKIIIILPLYFPAIKLAGPRLALLFVIAAVVNGLTFTMGPVQMAHAAATLLG